MSWIAGEGGGGEVCSRDPGSRGQCLRGVHWSLTHGICPMCGYSGYTEAKNAMKISVKEIKNFQFNRNHEKIYEIKF